MHPDAPEFVNIYFEPRTSVRSQRNARNASSRISDVIQIRLTHARKLRRLFEIYSPKSSNQEFLDQLYVMLRRYHSLMDSNKREQIPAHLLATCTPNRESASMHAASPPRVFAFLREQLGVHHECFASPLNCYFRSFCSAYPDVDAAFGSRGSFFDFRPTGGSFEVGPPYVVEVMEQTARHCLALLETAETRGGALSLVVIVPDWRTPLQTAQELMEKSRFRRRQIHIPGGAHAFVVGDQHLPRWDTTFVLPFDTEVYVLQSSEGVKKYPTEEEFGEQLINLYNC